MSFAPRPQILPPTKTSNRFYIWPLTEAQLSPFVPSELIPMVPASDIRYFARILQHVDEMLPQAGLTFVLTWHVNAFDEVMKDAVILLIGDERYQIPAYRNRVHAIFKTGGVGPNPLKETLRLPISVASRLLLREMRNTALRTKRRWRDLLPGERAAPMYAVPLGCFALQEFQASPIARRPVDVFFAGGLSAAGFTLRSSVSARKQMGAALEVARRALPQYRIVSSLQLITRERKLSPMEYTRAMAEAKIALAPRGNFDETFRLFEAARLGCVIISEPLPQRWYYDGCPVVQIRAWAELPKVLTGLLDDQPRLVELSDQTLRWWNTMLSEPMMARYICDRLSEGPSDSHRRVS